MKVRNLWWAVKNEHVEVVRLLLEKKYYSTTSIWTMIGSKRAFDGFCVSPGSLFKPSTKCKEIFKLLKEYSR